MESIVVSRNKSYNLPLNLFSKTDFSFTHWNTEEDNSGTSYNDNSVVRNLAAANAVVILFAQWAEFNDLDELAGLPKAQSSWGTLILNMPSNIGNTFTACPYTTRTISWQSNNNIGEVLFADNRFPSTVTNHSGHFIHRVDITGLTAGETYRYIAGSEGAVYTFTTKSTNLDSFYIIHVTDSQIDAGNHVEAAAWKRTIDSAVNKYPNAAFIVNTGDVVQNMLKKQRQMMNTMLILFWQDITIFITAAGQ